MVGTVRVAVSCAETPRETSAWLAWCLWGVGGPAVRVVRMGAAPASGVSVASAAAIRELLLALPVWAAADSSPNPNRAVAVVKAMEVLRLRIEGRNVSLLTSWITRA